MTKQMEHARAFLNAGLKPQFPAIRCLDGAFVSVQASSTHYCQPRNDEGPYATMEAGFPSVPPPLSWMAYAEDPNRPCETVYSHLTNAHINEFITAHGGLDLGGML